MPNSVPFGPYAENAAHPGGVQVQPGLGNPLLNRERMADLSEFHVPGGGGPEDAGALGTGISRRTLVKAGAVTAWTVPMIQVIAAAPAHAATSTGGAIPKLVIGNNKASASYSSGGSTLMV